VYRRADLWRTIALVVALLLTAVSTGVFAREFRTAGLPNERHQVDAFHSRRLAAEKAPLENIKTGAIDLDRTIVALIGIMPPVLIARLGGVELS
jgi:hypothetical protein